MQGSLQVLRVAPNAWGRHKSLRESARAAGVAVRREPGESLDRRAEGRRHQGVIGEGGEVNFTEMSDFLKTLRERGNNGMALILDGVTDPYNFGAILRSAAAANVDGVVFQERRSAQVNDSVIRASAGTVGRIPLVRVVNLGRAVDELKDAGLWIFGMSASSDNSRSYLDENFDRASAIILGSEGDGLRLKIEERCDSLLKIEMPGKTNSLNVSATAAIVLFRVIACREKKS
jgi:23S rRNA (guanosine2251-2'-O)-methyltransferase